jgi:hypothetical protein
MAQRDHVRETPTRVKAPKEKPPRRSWVYALLTNHEFWHGFRGFMLSIREFLS